MITRIIMLGRILHNRHSTAQLYKFVNSMLKSNYSITEEMSPLCGERIQREVVERGEWRPYIMNGGRQQANHDLSTQGFISSYTGAGGGWRERVTSSQGSPTSTHAPSATPPHPRSFYTKTGRYDVMGREGFIGYVNCWG